MWKVFWINTFFLNNRHQRVVLNGQSSYWSQIKGVVQQGSILGILLFLVNMIFSILSINDLHKGLNSDVQLFADTTPPFSVARDPRVTTE